MQKKEYAELVAASKAAAESITSQIDPEAMQSALKVVCEMQNGFGTALRNASFMSGQMETLRRGFPPLAMREGLRVFEEGSLATTLKMPAVPTFNMPEIPAFKMPQVSPFKLPEMPKMNVGELLDGLLGRELASMPTYREHAPSQMPTFQFRNREAGLMERLHDVESRLAATEAQLRQMGVPDKDVLN